jgi:pyridoxamine 5'-phosphate oxidase
VIPDEFEFWQGRPSRLHDRIQYRKQADGLWVRTRLAP